MAAFILHLPFLSRCPGWRRFALPDGMKQEILVTSYRRHEAFCPGVFGNLCACAVRYVYFLDIWGPVILDGKPLSVMTIRSHRS